MLIFSRAGIGTLAEIALVLVAAHRKSNGHAAFIFARMNFVNGHGMDSAIAGTE
jgi:hypothetical protein